MKTEILEAALALACEKGLSGISMSMIAERVQLKKSSLYSHYSSKEEIIRAMYEYFRERAKRMSGEVQTDYGAFVEGKTFREILNTAVHSYRSINSDPMMASFYRLIESERARDPQAAAVIVEESRKMIGATKMLFYAMAAKSVARFDHVDAAAVSFAMGVHAILDLECDCALCESSEADGMMETFINEFCDRYEKG